MSIRVKINLLLLVLGLSTSIFIGYYSYRAAKTHVFEEALTKAEMISAYAMAARNYTANVMRPIAMKIAGSDKFHPELMGGFYVSRAVSELFSQIKPGYMMKQATLNPVNIFNTADSQEANILAYFSQNKQKRLKKGVIEKWGETFFYVARPVTAKASCLKCHGNLDSAPKDRVNKYPGFGGYGFEVNEVVAALVTYVPIKEALQEAKKTAFQIGIIGILGVVFIITIVWMFISAQITKPLLELTELANEISMGRKVKQKIASESSAEIAALYKAFDRMRLSVMKFVQALKASRRV